jgi:dolichyl-phosphate beta-glucosyltransferase
LARPALKLGLIIRTSIVIPAYNEAPRLATGFERLRPILDELDLSDSEVVVVDDGSSDETMRVAHDLYGALPHTQFIQQPVNRGKGAAVRLGIAVAKGQCVIAADADMSINPRHFVDIVTELALSELVPGSRVDHGHIDYDSPLRTWAGKSFNRLARHYSGTTLRDTQCGCKGFQRGPARLLGLLGLIDGFAFDAEIFFLAKQLGLTVTPLTVTWDDVSGSSVRIGRDTLAMVRDLRALPRTRYVNPVVELPRDVSVTNVIAAARSTRVQGLVIARGAHNALLVLPRDGSLAGLGIAEVLHGTLRTAGLEELRARTYDAV